MATNARRERLAAIAKKHLGFETLDTRNSDSADFRYVAVWNLEAALEAAFQYGAEAQAFYARRRDGSTVRVTVPPSACQACGGDGCKRCKNSDGYEPGEN